jgi:hypothetical protein
LEKNPLKLMLSYLIALGIPLKLRAIWARKKIYIRVSMQRPYDLHLILVAVPRNNKSFIVILHDKSFVTIFQSHYTTICQSCCTAIHRSNIKSFIASCSKKTTKTNKPWKWVMKQHLVKMINILKCQVHLNIIPLSCFIES